MGASTSTKNESLISRFVNNYLQVQETISDVTPSKILFPVAFMTVLLLIYIGNRHYAEKNIKEIIQIEREIEDLRADYTTLKADYMLRSKQSEVAKSAQKIGLEENKSLPKKIFVEK